MKPNPIGEQISGFLYKHHFVLFVIIVIGSMSIVVYMINQALQNSTSVNSSATTSSIPTTFDRATINQVNNLRPPTNQPPLSLPTNTRTNPFVE